MKRMKKTHGFTLVELIAIMAIIAIMAAILIPTVRPMLKKGKENKARSDIARLEVAIQSYSNDMGYYPATTDNAVLVSALLSSADANWRGPYIELKQEELSGGNFIDPWGWAYHYVRGNQVGGTGTNNPSFVEIYSNGPDENDNGGDNVNFDDINNWTRQ